MPGLSAWRHRRTKHVPPAKFRMGFTLAESLMAMAVATISSTAVLTSLSSAIQTTNDALNNNLAQGLAEQLMDEVSATRFPASTNVALPNGTPRAAFNDMDDFSNYSARPPVDRNGYAMGTEGPGSQSPALRALWMQPDPVFLAGFTQQVLVERLLPGGTGGWTVVSQSTNYRRVTVTISLTSGGQTSTAAQVVRVFAYAPPGV